MNCSVVKNGDRLIINVTLSERNIDALKSGAIERSAETLQGVRVLMVVEMESDVEHYNSPMREKDFRGVAGGLHRFDEEGPVTIERKA